MTVPDWWQAVLLILAAYRLTRLGGWDAWRPIRRVRAWVIGERWLPDIPSLIEHGERVPLVPSTEGGVTKIPGPGNFRIDGGELELPGKQPSSEASYVRPAYDRPTLAHLVHCPFCLGFWVTLACWGGFQASPHWALVGLSPFALAGAVGLIGKDLD